MIALFKPVNGQNPLNGGNAMSKIKGLLGVFVLISFSISSCSDGDAGSDDNLQDSEMPSDGDTDSDSDGDTDSDSDGDTDSDSDVDGDTDTDTDSDTKALDPWYAEATVSMRELLPVPSSSDVLRSGPIIEQLELYDPGSLLRCEVHDDPAYRDVVDAIGGVTWGYYVRVLEDESKPRFFAGFPDYSHWFDDELNAGDVEDPAVEIEEADIIGLSSTSALYYSSEHGLLMVDLSGDVPRFDCATKLPGRVNKFFFYRGRLVAMTEQITGTARHSYLLHFDVTEGALRFIEAVDLGAVHILDTRRFNERLVIYTDLTLEDQENDASDEPGDEPIYYEPHGLHRSLRVFTLGDTLTEEMNDTLLDTSPNASYLTDGGIDPETAPGTLVYESSSFGRLMWASDHYFVVTEEVRKTYLESWETRTYSVCTESHTVEVPYTYCYTVFEERPNPDYTPPDNSGGDRGCDGMTLSDCLRAVSRAANPTIQVPVGRECEERIRTHWICDARETRSYTYPELTTEYATRLYIYEYTSDGFIRLDSKVSEIVNEGLESKSQDAVVPTLTTSTETFDLAVPGRLQTLYFQNDMLYAIADGMLQVYAMGGASLVRTSSLQVVEDRLQTSLFTNDKLYLSDFGYSGIHDESILRVIDLSNPAFPSQASDDRTLPGGHRAILPVDQGILTIGDVRNFEPGIEQVIKLGLFTDPFAAELSYLILGTDLKRSYLGEDKAYTFDWSPQRLFLPYSGTTRDTGLYTFRIGVSHLEELSFASEGAVTVPEMVQRVRKRPGKSDEALSFASSSIEWLRPAGDEWAATPVLEYFKPIALYRLTDEDDYVEVLRLGGECMLHFSAADTINVTREDSKTEPFDCSGGFPWAFEKNIIFSDTIGIGFTVDGEIAMLTEEEIAEFYERQAERPYCLFSQELVADITVDFDNPPPLEDLVCYTPEEYQAKLDELMAEIDL
jgi:hypothetical protein